MGSGAYDERGVHESALPDMRGISDTRVEVGRKELIMLAYPKIPTVFERDPATHFKTLLYGQYATPELKFLKNCPWVVTEKVDGTNTRVSWDGERVVFGGKTENAQIPARLVERLQTLFPVELFKMLYPNTPMCLFGEGYGAKIQKGGRNYKPDGVDFVLFDVNVGGLWLERSNVCDIGDHLKIGIVPIVGYGTLQGAVDATRSGFKSQWGNFLAEGLVMRPETELCTRRGERIIAKIKHKDFAVQPKKGEKR